MFPARPAGWVAAVALLTAGCADKPPPSPPQAPAPVPPSPPGAVVAAVPQTTPETREPAPPTSPPGGPGWVYPQVPQTSPPLNGTGFGFAFDPVADRIRVVSDSEQNLRINPDTGTVAAGPHLGVPRR